MHPDSDSIEELGSDGAPAGLEVERSSSQIDDIKAPFDPADIDVISQVRTVDLLLARLRENELHLSPDFQRRANLWTDVRKSGLIESLLLRIPIPSMYVSEDMSGDYTVVDGLQRICAIAHFVDVASLNKAVGVDLPPLQLTELQSIGAHYEKVTFKELPRSLQRRIVETEITLHVIRASTPQAVKFNIFSRINRGGLPLSAQEIRNAIFPGHWRDIAKSLAESSEFRKATGGRIRGERMEDVELVLRFLAHFMVGEDYRRPDDQNLDDFLNDFAQNSGQIYSDEDWHFASESFLKAMRSAPQVFGEHAFRKYFVAGDYRKPINRGLFEAQAVVLGRTSDSTLLELKNKRPLVLQKFAELLNTDAEFASSLLYATGRGSSANTRISKLSAMLGAV